MDIRSFTVTGLAALSLGLGSLQVVCAENVAPPPAPRPWEGQASSTSTTSTGSTTTTSTKTEANGSRLRVSDQAAEEARPKPKFASEAPLRDESSYYIGVSAGMNFAQGDEINVTGLDQSGDLAPVGGFKLGYVYPFDSEPIDQFRDETRGEGLRLAGGLELEAFYLRNNSEYTIAGATRDFNLDAGYFMLNAFLKARVTQFTLYAGPGVGLAWTHASGNAVVGEQDEAFLAYQMTGGVEYLFAKDWSVFTEYKWLVTDDYSVNLAGAGNTDYGMFQQHLISFGLKRHF